MAQVATRIKAHTNDRNRHSSGAHNTRQQHKTDADVVAGCKLIVIGAAYLVIRLERWQYLRYIDNREEEEEH